MNVHALAKVAWEEWDAQVQFLNFLGGKWTALLPDGLPSPINTLMVVTIVLCRCQEENQGAHNDIV